MSTSDKPDLARGWLRAEKLLDEEADRIATMSDEEFEREMRALPEPSHVPTADELRARGAERARKRQAGEDLVGGATVLEVPVARPSRTPWVVWLVAAAFGALAVVLVVERREVIAWFTRDSIGPDNNWAPERAPNLERAAALRGQAFDACGRRLWDRCEDELNEAKKLDPAGDSDPRVEAAHAAALDGLHREAPPRDPDTKSRGR